MTSYTSRPKTKVYVDKRLALRAVAVLHLLVYRLCVCVAEGRQNNIGNACTRNIATIVLALT